MAASAPPRPGPGLARRLPYFAPRFHAMAHRGAHFGPTAGQENTLAAFRAAADLGYRYIETDVQATRDGRLVVFHDDTLERLTGAPGRIADRRHADLAALRVGGQPIPAFDEALEEFPRLRFNIDLKTPGAVEPLVRVLARHQAGRRVLVGSFSQARLSRFRALTSGLVPTAAGVAGVAWTAFVPLLPRLLASPGVALQVPLRHRLGPFDAAVFTRRLVANAHAAGRVVHVWTVDDAAVIEAVVDAGADGIMTDRPDILKQVLRRRDLWEADDEQGR
ncbi:MAG: glycerophosphodiester phosphodiesterase [Propionibacteriaceae bacterium]|jgi:glycerophosphoryl diester phosphodiesterase|nr:glycerophosphodiester phosphodiesterase [Propionibacteriaceae bacterium]